VFAFYKTSEAYLGIFRRSRIDNPGKHTCVVVGSCTYFSRRHFY